MVGETLIHIFFPEGISVTFVIVKSFIGELSSNNIINEANPQKKTKKKNGE